MPAWTYRRARGKSANPVVFSEDKVAITSRQTTDYLLCDVCEQRFSRAEREGAELAWRDHEDPAFLDRVGPVVYTPPESRWRAALPGRLPLEELTYLGASVLWRSSVSPKMPKVSLGPYEETFRAFLYGGSFPAAVTCVVGFYDLPVGELSYGTMSASPAGSRHEGYHSYRLLLAGIGYIFNVGNRIPESDRGLCAHHANVVLLIPQEELLDWPGRLMVEAPRFGALARARAERL